MSFFYNLKIYLTDSLNKIFLPIDLQIYKRNSIFELWVKIQNQYLFLKFFTDKKEIDDHILNFSKLCMKNKLFYSVCCLYKQYLPREKCVFCGEDFTSFLLKNLEIEKINKKDKAFTK